MNTVFNHSIQAAESSFIRLLKDWTLPFAIGFGISIYFLFAFTPQLSDAAEWFGPIIDTIFPIFMVMILFVVFCKVDFHKLHLVGWHWQIVCAQLVFTFLICIFALTNRLSPTEIIIAEATLCCVISPCAAAAPVVTQKLGGNLEEMTSFIFLSNLVTAILIPLIFPLIDSHADIPFLSAFLKILRGASMVLILPMFMAYMVKHHFHRFHLWIISIKDLSFYTWAVSLTIVSGTTMKNIIHSESTPFLLCIIALLGFLMCLVQFYCGWRIGKHTSVETECGQALGQKNTAFAIWIAYTYLSPLSSVGPGCYILWQNIINSIEIYRKRKEASLHKDKA